MNMNKKEKTRDYKFALEQAIRWIESADSKTGIALTLISIAFSIYTGFLLSGGLLANKTKNFIPLLILLVLSLLTFGVSIYFYIVTIIPRITKPVSGKNSGENIFYYEEVSTYTSVENFINATEKDISNKTDELLIKESLFYNSKIASKKMKNFRIGLVSTGLYFLVSTASVLVVIFS